MRRGFISFLLISAFSSAIAIGHSSGLIDVLGQNGSNFEVANHLTTENNEIFPVEKSEFIYAQIPEATPFSSPAPTAAPTPTPNQSSEEIQKEIPIEIPTEINIAEATTPAPIADTVPAPSASPKSGDQHTVFLGDSITEGLSIYGFFPESKIFGINSLNTISANEQIAPVSSIRPAKLFLLLGINDIWEGDSVDEFIDRYRSLISEIKDKNENCSIYVESIMPVSEYAMENNTCISNKIIDGANVRIQAMAKELGVNYIDVNTAFKDEKGNLKKEYSNDGVHIINSYYPIWTDILASCM